MASVKVGVFLAPLEKKFSNQNIRRGRYALANQMLSDMDQFVPRKEGDLRTAVSISLDGSKIYYHMPYAQKMHTQRFKNYTTPGTGPYWDRKAALKYGFNWTEVFAKGAEFK